MFQRPRLRPRRLVATAASVTLSLSGLLIVLAAPASAATTRGFTPVFTANAPGDVTIRGNTLETCVAGSVQAQGTITCAATQNGASQQNNNYFMTYVDTDGSSGIGAATFDSSTATVTVPAGATVLYAGLSWGAVTTAGSLTDYPALTGVAAPNASLKTSASLRAPGAADYSTVTSATTDTNAGNYQAYADVTATVQAAGSGVYTVANVQAGTGGGNYAGWSLAVAYNDPTMPTRNLTVFTGYNQVSTSTPSVNITVSGFTTPPTGQVKTTVGVVAYEGDKGSTGDGMSVGGTALSNALNPVNDVFNSSITDLNVAVTDRTPSYANTLGYDIDRFDATGALANGSTGTTIHLTTSAETYYPGMVTFATDLYGSALTATKTVTDVNGGSVNRNDVLSYSIGVTNGGGDSAIKTVLTDAVPVGTTYVTSSLVVGGTAVSDASGDDTGEVSAGNVTARLGAGATATVGGQLPPATTVTVTFRVTVNPSVADATNIANTASFSSNSLTTGTGTAGASNTVTSAVVVAPSLAGTLTSPGEVGTAYSSGLTINGGTGTGPYVWSISAGTLPGGLSIDPASGLITGTPTTPGPFSFTVRVTDVNSRTGSRPQSITIAKTTTAISLSAPTSARFGTSVTLSAAVTPTSASGTVTFTDVPVTGPQAGTTVTLGTSTLATGTASVSAALPAFGVNTITARYAGDSTNASATSSTAQVEVSAYAGEIIVTEFRSSGPGGAADSYVELLNTGPAVPLAGIVVTTSSGSTSTLPANAGVLGPRRSYLITGSGFSLGAVATSDFATTLGTGGIAVVAPDTAHTQTDAVGPASGLHLGTGLPAMTGTPSAQYAWVRGEQAGAAVDTRNNAADFVLVSSTLALVGGVQPTLGSASPTGSADPFQHNAGLLSTLLDPGSGAAVAPNRVVVSGNPGTLIVRRTITNTTGATITAAKVRVSALSELYGPAQPGVTTPPATVADLRMINPAAPTQSVAVPGGPAVTVYNLSVDLPITSSTGGGLNSTLTLPLPGGGLANGAAINVAFTMNIDTHGTFWFGYDVDATTGNAAAARSASRPAGVSPRVTRVLRPIDSGRVRS